MAEVMKGLSESAELSAQQELKVLKLGILENQKEFEQFVKNSLVKSGMKKVFDKVILKEFSEQFKQYEKLNIKKEIDRILKKQPKLWLYISGDLGLSTKNQNFSSLTNQQKLNFIALKDALTPNKFQEFFTKKEELFSEKEIISRVNSYRKNQASEIDASFKSVNRSNVWNLEKTLKTDFGLTNAEVLQCVAYLKFIDKNPQFIRMEYAYESKASAGGALGLIAVGVVLGVLGSYFISSIGKMNPETNIYSGRTEIKDPENILRLLTQEAEFSNVGEIEKKMFIEEGDDGLLVSLGKRVINTAQSKKVRMELEGKLALQYDMGRYCKMELDHATGIVHLTLPQPELIVIESKAKVLNKSNERVQLKAFDNAELELQQQLKQQAVNDALKDPAFYQKAKDQTKNQLFSLLKSLNPYGVQVRGVVIHEAVDIVAPKD